MGVCIQLTYYEFAKEELEQLCNGMSSSGATSSFTSTSSDTQESSERTGQTTPVDREKHLQEEDYAQQQQQQQQHVGGGGPGEQMPTGARHYTVHKDSQQEAGGEETSGARQLRYSLACVL